MIVDRIQNAKAYPLGNAWQLAFEFLVSLKPDAEEKKYHVQGDDIFAMVMSCKHVLPIQLDLRRTGNIWIFRRLLPAEKEVPGSQRRTHNKPHPMMNRRMRNFTITRTQALHE